MKPHLFSRLASGLSEPANCVAVDVRRGSGIFRCSAIRSGAVRYELIELLANGGMASVFLAAQCRGASIDRLVALKTPRPILRGRFVPVAQQLLREGHLGARISHPNVVRTLDLVRDEDRSILVLEFVEGVAMRELLPKPSAPHVPVPLPMALGLVRDLLTALEAVHDLRGAMGERLGVVHRDVAPGNVLVGIDGRARLTDFGLARPRAWLPATAPAKIEGTLRYLSPEQARGEVVDRRSDLFAAGILLFELLTGRRLYSASTSAELLHTVRRGAMRASVDLEAASIPEALRAVCLKALATSREDRFPTARAFGCALDAAARNASGVASHDITAQWLDSRFGELIDRQRQRIAEWRAGIERRPRLDHAVDAAQSSG